MIITHDSAPELLSFDSCGIHVLYGAYSTGLRCIDWELDKLLKDCFRIFKKLPVSLAD